MDAMMGDPPDDALRVRIHPCPEDALGPLARAAVGVARRATHGEALRVLTTVGLHRRLLRRWLPFATSLLRGTELPRGDVELVILRTARNCASPYIWTQHVPLAGAAGLGADALALVAGGRGEGRTARQDALVLATDELHDHRVVSDATWARLAPILSERELIELCFIVGHYEMVAMTVNSLGVEPEPTGLARLGLTDARVARSLGQVLAARRQGRAPT